MTQRLPRGGGGRELNIHGCQKNVALLFHKRNPMPGNHYSRTILATSNPFPLKIGCSNVARRRRTSPSLPPSLSPARRRIGDSTPSPSPRFYYRIFVTAITMPSRARGRENNRDASRTGRRVDIEFIRLRES